MNDSLNEKLIVFINSIAKNVFLVQFVISTIGLVTNVPHLLILLHNSMRTSSTNSMMIGIAICDLIVLSEFVYERVQSYWFYGSQNPCINQYKFWYQCSLLIGKYSMTVFERASFWLGVFLAFTRLFIMKKAGTTLIISNPLFGYFLVLVLVALSLTHSAYLYRGYSITQWGVWEPESTCGYPDHYSEPAFGHYFADMKNMIKIIRRYKLISGVSWADLNFLVKLQLKNFQFLVSVIYPILTILLIFEIRKSVKFASKALNSRISEERHRTCRLILVMTILYVVTSVPAGISGYVQLFVKIKPNSVLETLVGYGSVFISALFCLNASSHGIINLTMSSKYRETVRKCLRPPGTVPIVAIKHRHPQIVESRHQDSPISYKSRGGARRQIGQNSGGLEKFNGSEYGYMEKEGENMPRTEY